MNIRNIIDVLDAGGPGSGPNAPCPQCGPKGGHGANDQSIGYRQLKLPSRDKALALWNGEFDEIRSVSRDIINGRSYSRGDFEDEELKSSEPYVTAALKIMDEISKSENVNEPLFRIIGLNEDPKRILKRYAKGKHFSDPPASYGSNKETFDNFRKQWFGNVIFEVESGAKAISTPTDYDSGYGGKGKEYTTGGNFHVTDSRIDSEGIVRIKVKQVGTFNVSERED